MRYSHPTPGGRHWRCCWWLGTRWRGFRHEFWSSGEFRALYTGTWGDWAAYAFWLGGVQNAVAGSLRA